MAKNPNPTPPAEDVKVPEPVKAPVKAPPPESKRLAKLMASSTMATIHKEYGDVGMLRAREARIQTVHRIPVGPLMLDFALGGGLPVGRTTTTWGKPGGGKTSLYLRAIANAQRMCANCWTFLDEETGRCVCGKYLDTVVVYEDVEGTFDLKWAKLLKVDLDRLVLDHPESAEEALNKAEALMRSKDCDIIVLDSIAFLSGTKEIKGAVGAENPGLQARLMAQSMRKFTSALNHMENRTGRRCTLWFTNQTRMTFTMFGNPETISGGSAARFAASLEIRTWTGKPTIDEKTGRPLYVGMQFKVEKSKVCVPYIEGEFKMILSPTETKSLGDVYDEDVMTTQANRMGMISRKGGKWWMLNEGHDSLDQITRHAMIDPGFRHRMKMEVLRALLEELHPIMT